MKNKILMLGAVLALATSCQDAHNIDQPGYRFEESGVFDTPADIERGLSGLYASLPGEGEIEFVSFFTDELGIGRDNGGQGVNDGSYRFFMNSGNDYARSLWESMYNVINRTNRLLNRIEELKVQTPNNAGELEVSARRLKVIRAFANLKLFSYFTPDYTNQSGLSILKLDFLQTDDYSKHIGRATVKEIVEFIESDITAALGTSPSDLASSDANANGYVSANMAYGILVKLYAMTGDSDKLIAAFNNITGASEGTALEYLQTFGNQDESALASNPDLIFRLIRIPTVDGGQVASAWWSGRVDATNGTAYMEIGRSLYNELDKLDPTQTGNAASVGRDDVRYSQTVLGTSTPVANYATLSFRDFRDRDLLFIGKYPGSASNRLQNDIKVMRYTDLLLCYAEAQAAKGNYTEVLDIITRIRNNRSQSGATLSVLPTVNSAATAYRAILEERRVEFAFEGHRYLDMKRIGKKAGSAGFVRDAKDCESTAACQLETSSHKLTLPIPNSEMLSNPAVAGQQNPGY